MSETIETIIAWHKETFPDIDENVQWDKWCEEYNEFYQSEDLEELADMFISACGLLRFSLVEYIGCFFEIRELLFELRKTQDDLKPVVNNKMKINRKRKWANNRHV